MKRRIQPTYASRYAGSYAGGVSPRAPAAAALARWARDGMTTRRWLGRCPIACIAVPGISSCRSSRPRNAIYRVDVGAYGRIVPTRSERRRARNGTSGTAEAVAPDGGMRRTWMPAILLAVLVIAAYAHTFGEGFLLW